MKLETKKNLRRLISVTIFFVVVFIAWEYLVIFLNIPRYVLPTPSGIGISFIENSELLYHNTWETVYETILGFGVAIVVGIGVAIVVVSSKSARDAIYPFLVALNALPKIVVAPLLVLWLGFGAISKVVLAFITAFFPIVINTATGLGEIDPDMIYLLNSMKATNRQIFTKIRLPHSLPYMFDGFRISITLCVVGAIIGEFVGATKGLGYLILICTNQIRTELAFAAMVIIVLVSFSLFALIDLVDKRLIKWRPSKRKV